MCVCVVGCCGGRERWRGFKGCRCGYVSEGCTNTVESGYLAHFVIWRTSSIRRMSYSCLNSTLSGAHNLIKRKMGGAGY